MPTEGYSAAAIVGKVLDARSDVPIFSNVPERGGKPIGTIKAGNTVGEVYSYITAKDGTVWWQFKNAGRWFYAQHLTNAFDISSLRDQGVISVKEQTELAKKKEEEANASWYDKLFGSFGASGSLLPKIALGAAAVYLLGKFITRR